MITLTTLNKGAGEHQNLLTPQSSWGHEGQDNPFTLGVKGWTQAIMSMRSDE